MYLICGQGHYQPDVQEPQSLLQQQPQVNSGHSTHFEVGGDNPKVEGQEFF